MARRCPFGRISSFLDIYNRSDVKGGVLDEARPGALGPNVRFLIVRVPAHA